ncbi:hypothetical protein A4G31_27870 [Mycobacterium persicum]|uniref:Uncharacterized protein n=1 Tax=Mycobacterium ostraviense TaxID=2738409 RepID=A0A164LK39_9MYCO|nr:hypothetical protein A4G28_01815 [Mycobacterium ostraviense]KZS85899.1 hypothetical protein A4G31_27870 [Mycobacterium persicum]
MTVLHRLGNHPKHQRAVAGTGLATTSEPAATHRNHRHREVMLHRSRATLAPRTNAKIRYILTSRRATDGIDYRMNKLTRITGNRYRGIGIFQMTRWIQVKSVETLQDLLMIPKRRLVATRKGVRILNRNTLYVITR